MKSDQTLSLKQGERLKLTQKYFPLVTSLVSLKTNFLCFTVILSTIKWSRIILFVCDNHWHSNLVLTINCYWGQFLVSHPYKWSLYLSLPLSFQQRDGYLNVLGIFRNFVLICSLHFFNVNILKTEIWWIANILNFQSKFERFCC